MSREERKTAQIWASIEKMQKKEEENNASSDNSSSAADSRSSKRKKTKKKDRKRDSLDDDATLTMHKSDCQSWRSGPFVPPKKKWCSRWAHNHPRVQDVQVPPTTSPRKHVENTVPEPEPTPATESVHTPPALAPARSSPLRQDEDRDHVSNIERTSKAEADMNATGSRRKRKSLWDVGDPRLSQEESKEAWAPQPWSTSPSQASMGARRYQPYIQPRGRSWATTNAPYSR
ncbi:hypothetical protein ACHHYP_10312 [Achlya hypogyna]|uniref:Uncharacterized protein n=1 Tax=Achlya hypogyna TaxID=1202772 RepID=A0A1V9YLR5_ACHHY|nr:hypothetical protein ACHHYP_10312 [Achlya hypogyna]